MEKRTDGKDKNTDYYKDGRKGRKDRKMDGMNGKKGRKDRKKDGMNGKNGRKDRKWTG